MKLIKAALFATAFLISVPSNAAEFVFGVSVDGTNGNGTFTTAGDPSGGFTLINSLNGTFGGLAMNLLAPGSFPQNPGEENDNLFTSASPFFTFRGLSFAVGGTNYNLWNNGGSLSACVSGQSCFQQASFSARATTPGVPEPATWAMMLLGFLGIGAMVRSQRRRQKLTVSYA